VWNFLQSAHIDANIFIAEKFSCVTIFFSDIVTFTDIASASTPLEIVSMLNSMYEKFDKLTNKYDVYKVRNTIV